MCGGRLRARGPDTPILGVGLISFHRQPAGRYDPRMGGLTFSSLVVKTVRGFVTYSLDEPDPRGHRKL